MPRNKITDGAITNCTACGWSGSYDADCDCIPCNVESARHLAQHNGTPERKPMARAFGPRTKSTLMEAIERRA